MNSLDKGSEKGFCDDGVFFRVFEACVTHVHYAFSVKKYWLDSSQCDSAIASLFSISRVHTM